MNFLRFIFFLALSLTIATSGQAQSVDSNRLQPPGDTNRQIIDTTGFVDSSVLAIDSAAFVRDTMSFIPSQYLFHPSFVDSIPFNVQIQRQYPYFDFQSKPVAVNSQIRIFHGKEPLFYSMVALLLMFALLKLAFAKYFADLFRVFFRTTMKQRQIREQLMQTPFPSLLFNIFFVATTAMYINFIFQYYDFRPVDNFWVLYLYCCIGLALIYLGKFVGLKVSGWIFNMQQAADSYIFIVFIINKVIGVFLLPIVVVLAFSDGVIQTGVMALSWCVIGVLVIYRFILGYGVIRNEVRFNLFHFFLYLCAFEVAPLLLIYKLLLFFFK